MPTNRIRTVLLKRVRRFAFTAFHCALIAFGVYLMIGPIISAQGVETRVIVENLKAQIKALEDERLDSRLSVVEAIQQQQLGWMQINASGTGLLIVGGAVSTLRRRKVE